MQIPLTKQSSAPSKAPNLWAWFMLAFILLGSIGAVRGIVGNNPQSKSLTDGTWSAAFEKQFNKTLPWRQAGIDTWGALEFFLFGNGRSGVLVGRDGWLFTSEEFKFLPKAQQNLEDHLQKIAQTQQDLAKSNVHLVVVLLPAKARVYPEYLGRYHFPSYYQNQYAQVVESLKAKGVEVIDPQPALLEAKAKGDVFLHTDTHWTPLGAQVVAEAIHNHLAQSGVNLPETTFQTSKTGSIAHKGDLLKYVPLGFLQDRGPAADTLEQFSTEQDSAGGSALFADAASSAIPVTLVGTSYSAKADFHFEGALKQALRADVLNMALEGKGPFKPMEEYLVSKERKDTPSSLVIWEIPERYLPMP